MNPSGEDQPEDPCPNSDEALMIRVQARDKAAFEELFHRYAGRIKGVLIRGGASGEEADEAAQEAMLAVWRRAETYDPQRAPASAWIFTIARNRRIDMIRRASRPAPDPADPLFHPDPPAASDAILAMSQRDQMVRQALGELNEDQKEAVRLAFFDGLSHQEVAARLSAPLGTVKSRLRLAVTRLRAALGDEFGSELLDD